MTSKRDPPATVTSFEQLCEKQLENLEEQLRKSAALYTQYTGVKKAHEELLFGVSQLIEQKAKYKNDLEQIKKPIETNINVHKKAIEDLKAKLTFATSDIKNNLKELEKVLATTESHRNKQQKTLKKHKQEVGSFLIPLVKIKHKKAKESVVDL